MQGDACESPIPSFQTENDIFACARVISSMETLQYYNYRYEYMMVNILLSIYILNYAATKEFSGVSKGVLRVLEHPPAAQLI